jgi:hypothetical protein
MHTLMSIQKFKSCQKLDLTCSYHMVVIKKHNPKKQITKYQARENN